MQQMVFFLCPHNAAKSVLAAAYFNQLAQQDDLPFLADSAGMEPEIAVSPAVRTMLAYDGIDVSSYVPRQVTREDMQTSAYIISMECDAEDLGVAPERVIVWSDVPPVSQQPEQACAVIRAHVERLIAELRTSSR
jgi:arsenate reductase (thioredoxin)